MASYQGNFQLRGPDVSYILHFWVHSSWVITIHNAVNATPSAPGVGTSSGAFGSGRHEASKVVIPQNPHSLPRKRLVLFRKQGLRVCTLNTRTLNSTGAAMILDQELQRWNIQLVGLQEVRWLDWYGMVY